MKPANFKTRTITAILFGIVMISAVTAGSVWFALLMLVVFNIGLIELYELLGVSSSKRFKLSGHLLGSVVFTMIFLYNYKWLSEKWLWFIPFLLVLPFIISIFENIKQSVNASSSLITGIIYLSIPLSLFASLMTTGGHHAELNNKALIFSFLAILWVNDSAAYIIGSWFGKNKLMERLSPGKTWEGSLGGLITAFLLVWVISLLAPEIALIHWIIIALLIVVFGTVGDLFESMLKRGAGLKDSGKLLPGHGGILDRFDAVLFSAPAVFFYSIIFIN